MSEEIRAKDIVPHKTSFSAGDGFYGDGDTSFFMEAETLLKLTAQNALAGNVAPAFDPNRTSENPYKAGESVIYNGKTYSFTVDHYGAWNPNDVDYFDDLANKIIELLGLRAIGKTGSGNVQFESSDFERGGIDGGTGLPYANPNLLRSKDFYLTGPAVSFTISVSTGYRVEAAFYSDDYEFLVKREGLTTTGVYVSPANARYVKFTLVYPVGDIHPVDFDTINLAISASAIYFFSKSAPVNDVAESKAGLDYLYSLRAIGVTGSGSVQFEATDFERGGIDGGTGLPYANPNLLRSKDFYRTGPAVSFTISVSTGYRVEAAFYSDDYEFLVKREGLTTTGVYVSPANARYVKFSLAYPVGDIHPVDFDTINLAISASAIYGFVRSMPYNADSSGLVDNYFDLPLPIYAPTQKPADGSADSDFDAESLTPAELYSSFDSLIDEAPSPNGLVTNPKLISEYYKEGDDASGTYKIKAYTLCVADRFAWLASDRLFAWKNGGSVIYTDSCSPRIGDATYADANRTSTGYQVTSYSSGQVTVNSVVYNRDDADNIGPVVLWSALTPNADGSSTTITLYDRSNNSQGRATLTDTTHCILSGKTYTRCASFDYNTRNVGTIVLWGNEHGAPSDPSEPAIILYRFARDYVFGNCADNKFMQYLKSAYKFVIIPVLNPYGMATRRRNNYNGVNINRNYDTVGWSVQADADKGSYPGDQRETQFCMNLVLNMDATLGVDVHCLGYSSDPVNAGRTHYASPSPGEAWLDYARQAMSDYGYGFSSYYAGPYTQHAEGNAWLESKGIAGGLIEMNAGPYASQYNGKQHKSLVLSADYALLLNAIRMWLGASLNLKKVCIK